MNNPLPRKEYQFTNLTKEEYTEGKVFYFYCDNMLEGIHILSLMEKFNTQMNLIKRGFNGISNYISIYDIEGQQYTIIICSFYHNGELPRKVRQMINKIDKPDVVVYSLNENKIICGIENTETGFVGNATWQRHGRIMTFLKNEIPFIFFAYYSKKDASRNQKRKPSPLFVLSFFSLSIANSTPAIIALCDHEDESQNIINKDRSKMIDCRPEAVSYILSLMQYGNKSDITFEKLKRCFYDMKYYYKKEIGRIREKELPQKTLELLRKEDFEEELVAKIQNKDKNYPLFWEGNRSKKYISKWMPVTKKSFEVNNEKVGIGEYLKNQFKGIDFYQLSPKCPVGITFDTEKLADKLSELKNTGNYFWEDSLTLELPTIMILMRLTKNGQLSLPDPYNGRIPAFYELYKQSFGEMNCIIYLIDHSNQKEYDPELAKEMKIFKSINDYATILIDRDLNIFDKNCDKVVKDSKEKYKEQTTEDNVTSFFGTILNGENIEPSFISPPSGSWSDFKLLPTNKFFYLKRDSDRPDIAYFIEQAGENSEKGIYYVGESKASNKEFKTKESYNREVDRINRFVQIIDRKIEIKVKYKTFILFKGTVQEGVDIIAKIRSENRYLVDYVIVIEENNESEENNIKMITLEV